MKKNINYIIAGLLLSNSFVFGASSLEEALKSGQIDSSLAVYNVFQDNKGGNQDNGYLSSALNFSYKTASYKGFNGQIDFIGVHVFHERFNGNSDDNIASRFLLSQANINYANEDFSVKIGRQKVDLGWMTDYHEAIMTTISPLPNTSIILGYSSRFALANVDEMSKYFLKINNNKGIYVANISYKGVEDFEINPYYYNAPSQSQLYGLKVGYTLQGIELNTQYAVSKEGTNSSFKNGSIFTINTEIPIKDLKLKAGYIKTDKQGAGSIIQDLQIADNTTLFEDKNNIYAQDSKTLYGGASYKIDDIDLGVLYGTTKYGNNKEKQLNLSANMEIIENKLEVGFLYVDAVAASSANNYKKYIVELEYSY